MKKAVMAAMLLLVVFVLATSASVADRLGTAGSFRSVGWAQCDAPFDQWKQGACDPAPVDPQLSGPALAQAHIDRAIALLAQARTSEAVKAANAAVAVDNTNIAARAFRGRVLLTALSFDEVERDSNAALLIQPGNPVLLGSRAEALLGMGKPHEALADISAAVAQRPHDADLQWIKARVHLNLGQVERAESALGVGLSREPDNRRMLTMRAQARLRLGKFQGAADDATQALAISISDPIARETRAIASIALGRTEEAVEDLNVLLGEPGEQSPAVTTKHNRELLFQRAILNAQLKRLGSAEADIGTLMSAGGKQAVLRVQLYLRQHGFPDVRLDGDRSQHFNDALKACIVDRACSGGLTQHL